MIDRIFWSVTLHKIKKWTCKLRKKFIWKETHLKKLINKKFKCEIAQNIEVKMKNKKQGYWKETQKK